MGPGLSCGSQGRGDANASSSLWLVVACRCRQRARTRCRVGARSDGQVVHAGGLLRPDRPDHPDRRRALVRWPHRDGDRRQPVLDLPGHPEHPVRDGVDRWAHHAERESVRRPGRGLRPPSSFQVAALFATRCTCDDGNTANGDGCDARCRIEPCWTCAGDPSVCAPASDGSACEDGSLCTTGETCALGACGGSTPVSPCTDMTGLWSRHQEIPGLEQVLDLVTDFEQRGTDVIAGGYVGTIDPATGAFDLRIVNQNLFCPAFDPLVGTVAPSGLTYAATGTVWVPQPLTPDHCDGFGLTETARAAAPAGVRRPPPPPRPPLPRAPRRCRAAPAPPFRWPGAGFR